MVDSPMRGAVWAVAVSVAFWVIVGLILWAVFAS